MNVVDRGRKLAAMAQTEGPEGDGARRRLRVLATAHPELSWLLAEGALEPDEVHLDAPTWIHVELLEHLAERLDCELHDDPTRVVRSRRAKGAGAVRRLTGPRGRLQQAEAFYSRHTDLISAAMDIAGHAILDQCTLPGTPPVVDDTDDTEFDLEEITEFLGVLDRWIAWRSRLSAALADVPSTALQTVTKRLAALLAPALRTPTVTLPDTTRAWNDAALTYPEFIAVHAAWFPRSELLEYEIRYKFRDGYRLYPPTRRYRLCRQLARPEGWAPDDPTPQIGLD